MKASLLICAMLCGVLSCFVHAANAQGQGANVVYSSASSPDFVVDYKEDAAVRRVDSVLDILPVSYGVEWQEDQYLLTPIVDRVEVCVNGMVLTSCENSGSLDWIPTIAGSYVLTHQGYKGGAPEGEMLTAKFNVLPTTTSISPASGTVIKNGDKVVMSCSDPNAVIYYTVDGTEPTVKSRVYTEPIECEEKTLFKAVGITRGVFKSNVVAAEYAFGFAQQPVFGQVSGTVFSGDGFTVSLTCQTAGVEIHYTVDGSAPTRESPLYTSPIALHGTTTVKAKAFSDKYFDSEISSAKYIRKAVVPVVSLATTFSGDYQSVTITSADGGAVIYYTLDGSAPSSTHGFVYNGPFKVDDSCMIRAVAAVGGYEMSDIVERKTTSLTPPSGVGNKVVSVTAAPRLPWNGKVDIGYRVEGNTRATNTVATITVSADDVGEVYIYAYEGVVGAGAGNYQIVWDAVQDGWKDVVSNVVVKVTLGSARADANEEIDVEFADQEWILDESETVDGVIPFKSPKVDDFGATSIIAHTPGPGYFSFKWKVASEANYDFLRCLINETEMRHISGVTGWEDAKVRVEDTVPVVFRWEYVKDQSGSVAPDCGWVGGIKWTTSYGAIVYSEKSAEPVVLGKVCSRITYANLHGSTHDNPDCYEEGVPLTFSAPANVEGYTFVGWVPGSISEESRGEQVVTANWTVTHYGITYNLEGGDNALSNPLTYTIEDEVTLAEPTRAGYTFSGWVPDGGRIARGSTGEKVFSASWTKNAVKRTISFDTNGGGASPTAFTGNEGDMMGDLPDLTRVGYSFVGWYTARSGGIKVSAATKITGDQILYAHWSAHIYHIVYCANGGSGTMATTSCEYDNEFEIAANGFSRNGYAFKGWALEAVGDVVYLPGAKVKNLSDAEGGEVRFYAVWERSDLADPVIAPADGAIFMTDSCLVSISCATEGATIYYSAKGTTPRLTDAYKYVDPFVITGTTTIKAVAVKGDQKSTYVTAIITKKTLTLADAVNAPSLTFTTGGVATWEPVADASAVTGGESARSGAMGLSETADGNISWMEVSVVGAGTLSFSWKVDCEWDESGACTWDRLMYFVDGADKDEDRIDGFTDWNPKSVTFTSGGVHTVRWVYFKDDYDDEDFTCEDCGWVDGVVWAPLTVLEPIPELPSSASADEVRVALEGSADAKLQENITDATVYGQYREWAMKIGAESVKDAANSWISFAVDSAALLEKVPVDSDLKIEEFKPASAEGAFDFTVSVKDVTIGSGATDANLKKVFGLGGTTQLGTEEFDPDKVALEFGTPVNGKLKFTASPKDKTAKSFFMKMKVK